MTQKCKFCKGEISQERIKGCRSKNVAYCSDRCGHNYWNEFMRNEKNALKPIKKCLYCGKKTTTVKDWCNHKCYHRYHATIDTTKISSADYEALNRSFIGAEESECVVV